MLSMEVTTNRPHVQKRDEDREQGEDKAKKAYADALDQDLPLPVRQLVAEQQAHVLTSHDFVRSHRDALAAK